MKMIVVKVQGNTVFLEGLDALEGVKVTETWEYIGTQHIEDEVGDVFETRDPVRINR